MKTLILAAIRCSLMFLLPTILAMTLIIGIAKADTTTTFNVFGTFTIPYSGTFGGTLTVDVTNGTVSSVDITFPGARGL
jgi:hypothetical protein